MLQSMCEKINEALLDWERQVAHQPKDEEEAQRQQYLCGLITKYEGQKDVGQRSTTHLTPISGSKKSDTHF